MPKALISDVGSYFCNKALESMLSKYGVHHNVTTAYHPQVNGQAKVSNREIKQIREKIISATRRDWYTKLEDAL